MYGSIIGDIVGSPYELNKGSKTKDFPLFSEKSRFTDDSVMTAAVAQGLMEAGLQADSQRISYCVQRSMREWGLRYPDAGYGSRFKKWLKSDSPAPYKSDGNGSAMRVSAAGWMYDDIERVREAARATAMPTHNHPEGIKGAEATASAIYMARKGSSKDEIKNYITENFGYDLSRTCDEIRPGYRHTSSCKGSIPEAITAFLEGTGFEDVIRTAVSLGGDTDTLAAIAGSIAEAFYGIPAYLIEEARKRIPSEMVRVLDRFTDLLRSSSAGAAQKQSETVTAHNVFISEAISAYNRNPIDERAFIAVLDSIRFLKSRGGCLLAPLKIAKLPDMIPENISVGDILKAEDDPAEKLCSVTDKNGKKWFLLFTDMEHLVQWKKCAAHPFALEGMREFAAGEKTCEGFIINTNDGDFHLSKDLIDAIFQADISTVWNVINPATCSPEMKKEILRQYSDKNNLFEGNDGIVKAIRLTKMDHSEGLAEFLFMMCRQVHANSYFIVPIKNNITPNSINFTPSGKLNVTPAELRSYMQEIAMVDENEKNVPAGCAFTDVSQFCKGPISNALDIPIITILECIKEWKKGDILSINPWDGNPFVINREIASEILECYEHVKDNFEHDEDGDRDDDNENGTSLRLVLGDITRMRDIEAIVNTADNSLSPLTGGINEAIHKAAGPQLAKECRKLGGCETGRSKTTKAYKLPCEHVIHTAVPEWHGGRNGEAKFLEECYTSCLMEAVYQGVRSIAIPPLVLPDSGFPVAKAAKIASETLYSILYDDGFFRKFDLIELVFEDEKTLAAYEKAIKKAFDLEY